MDYTTLLTSIAKQNGGIIETKVAIQNGVSKSMLSKLCKEGRIDRIMHGQYVLLNNIQDELVSISKRSDKIVFSHETALWTHGISDRTPFVHTFTMPTGSFVPTPLSDCKKYFIKPELFSLGKTELKTPAGNMVPVYDLERTICDIVRSRNKVGTETFLSALKAYATNQKKI